MADLIGRTLGQYRIIEQLGKGGMATVYRAFQPSLERYVAIKVLMPYFAHEEGFSQRFVREAKAIARLDHPHILPIYDYGQEGEIHYIVSKCVDTGTLKDLEAGEPVPLDQTVRIVSQIAEALDHAHERGVYHRDVKPANVLLDRGEWVFLADFGLARMVEGSQGLTASGVGVGTPAYMPPEQGQGRQIDRRADVYSLGIVLYEMLTGCVPFEAETPLAVVLKHITDPLPMPRAIHPALPETVERVILKALAKDRDDRYQSAGELAAALRAAVECAQAPAWTDPVPPEPPAPAAPSGDSAREGGATPSVSEPERPVPASDLTPPPAAAEKERDAAPAPAPEPVVRRQPVSSRPRVPGWAVVVAAIALLILVGGGVWLGLGGWSALTARVAGPTVAGTPTPAPVQPALPPAEPGASVRIAVPVEPLARGEPDLRRLAQFLTARTGMEADVIPVDSREGLLGLLHGEGVDVVVLSLPQYLWLRDDEGIPLEPALYASPVYAGVVVVRADGEIQAVDDLRGHPVALASWDAPAGLLGRVALMEQGLDVERACELVYVAPSYDPEAGAEALTWLGEGRVAAAIVALPALDRIAEQAPALAERLRMLAASRPTSAGVVAVRPELPAEQVSALSAALLELDPESVRGGAFLGRWIAVDKPLAEHLAHALRTLDMSAWQLVEGVAPEPQMPSEQPPRPSPSSDIRIGLLPAAGTSIERHRFALPILKGLEEASRDMGLELTVRETPEDRPPADAALDLIAEGYTLIVAVGWRDPDVLRGLALEHAEVRFVGFGHLDPDPPPNLVGYAFRMDQAGFLAGALAGRATESKRVAVIGGAPTPGVEQLVSGFEQGVQHACPECEVMVRFADTSSDRPLGAEVGRQVVREGADVVLNAAGAAGSAALRSAAQQGAWVIGVDGDEYLATFREGPVPHADRLLGSVVLRADRQAYETVERIARGEFEAGSFALGVAQGSIEFLPAPGNAHPRWPELEMHLREVTRGLESGELLP